nr:ribonuclease H-like domain-containing protein [Tanacetum cinerariifolium]
MIVGGGPDWLFDIDALSKSINYGPVPAGTNSNDFASKGASFNAGQSSLETGSNQNYILMPLWKDNSLFDSSSQASNGHNKDKHGPSKESKIDDQERPNANSSTKTVRPVNTATPTYADYPNDPLMPDLEDARILMMLMMIVIRDYALWDVIENGNSFKPVPQTTTNADGTSTSTIHGPVTTEEKVQKKNNVKARIMLLMALPNEHLLTFSQYRDTKTLFKAIQARLGGNDATKKTQRTLLKQMYKNFNAPSTDLPSEWNTYVVFWRNKADLDIMSIDGLYNNFKIVEQEVKRTITSSSSSRSPNMAFLFYHGSTNEVDTASIQVSDVSIPVSTVRSHDNTANLSDATMYAFLANQPNGSQLMHEDLEQIHKDDLGEIDLKWQLASLSMRAKRWDILQGNAEVLGIKKASQRIKTAQERLNVEDTSSKSIVAIDEACFDWSYMADDEVSTNMALMAFSDSEMCDKKNSVLFTDTECFVLSPNFKLADESQVLLKVPRKNNMYSFDMKNIVPEKDFTCLLAKATNDESILWHKIHGHINFKNINKLVKDNLVRGLPSKHFKNNQTCVACLKRKQHKVSFKSKLQNSNSQPLFMLHMDSFGPTSQNGVAKRRNRTLIEATWTMSKDSKLPTTFWAKAVNTACYVQNMVLVVKTHFKTPYELFKDEGIFVGYSITSIAFRVYNLRTRKVEENLHINFLENKPMIVGGGPEWLFDIDVVSTATPTYANYPNDPLMPNLEDARIFDDAYDDRDEGAEADYNNLETIKAIKLFLAYALFVDFTVYQMDVKSAFLYGTIKEETKILVDNESAICVVKNHVYHSKTKHIEIRHHFIVDSYEKRLIEMVKIHTDYNVTDLLTKAFDVPRSTINDNVRLQALIDGKKVVIIEASIRQDLKLSDAEDDEEVLNELSDYENAGILRRERIINSLDGDDLAFECMIGFRKFTAYLDPFLPMNIISRKAYNTIMVDRLEGMRKNLVAIIRDVYMFVVFSVFDYKLYLMRRSLEVLRKFHWMILGGRFNQLSHVSSLLLSKPEEY